MAMRETVRSLRAYFILTGLVSLISSLSKLQIGLQGSDTIESFILVVSIGFSLAFVYVGISLARLLKSSAGRIVALLYASAGWTLFFFSVGFLQGISPAGFIILILSLLIIWYLLTNVRRLAAEAQAPSSTVAPSGT